jgi:crotonobetainyl-CoA:carnitine CoA-transferase CaiB-like acyl-CoA transferase
VTAVFTVAEAAEHPHLAARDYFVSIDHPHLGTVRSLGAPFKLPACPAAPRGPRRCSASTTTQCSARSLQKKQLFSNSSLRVTSDKLQCNDVVSVPGVG